MIEHADIFGEGGETAGPHGVTVRAADLAWLLENAKWPVDHEPSCARLRPPILTAECDCAMSRLAAAVKGRS